MSTSYLAIPNDIDFNLSALFGMVASYVSVPGYQKTNGGLKKAVRDHVQKSPKIFERAWKGLYQAGYLKRVRMPKQCKIEIGFGEKERFYDFYQLFSSPATDVPSIRYMTIAQGKTFLHRSPAHYQGAVENYTGVSRKVLEDANLKLVDKNLYTLIRKLVLLQSRNENMSLSKEYIRYKSGLNMFKFNHAWRRLKEAGYLVVERSYDHTNNRTIFLFSLPMEQPTISRRDEAIKEFEKHKKAASLIFDYEQIKQQIEELTEADTLRDWAVTRSEAHYTEDDVNKALLQITDVLCSKKHIWYIDGTPFATKTLFSVFTKHLSATVMHNVLNIMFERPPKRNQKLYLLTLVYNECLSLMN